jgi:hypothetical protein
MPWRGYPPSRPSRSDSRGENGMTGTPQFLESALGEALNETYYAWVAYGPFEVRHIVDRLIAEVPPLAGSVADPDGFASSSGGRCKWVIIDADLGSAAFIIPSGLTVEEVRDPLLALGGGIKASAVLFGNVDDDVWLTLGGAGRRRVVAAQEFIH